MPDATSSYPPRFNGRHHPVYRRARDEAFARSRGVCQGCGQQPAVEVHHWAHQYPPAHATTADDLIALCADCHRLTTTLRRFTWAGGSRGSDRRYSVDLLARHLPLLETGYPSPSHPDETEANDVGRIRSVRVTV